MRVSNQPNLHETLGCCYRGPQLQCSHSDMHFMDPLPTRDLFHEVCQFTAGALKLPRRVVVVSSWPAFLKAASHGIRKHLPFSLLLLCSLLPLGSWCVILRYEQVLTQTQPVSTQSFPMHQSSLRDFVNAYHPGPNEPRGPQ